MYSTQVHSDAIYSKQQVVTILIPPLLFIIKNPAGK
jgi:hypothetical protein